MGKVIVYDADMEMPVCIHCDNFGDEHFNCGKSCGPEHGWYGYRRTEIIEEVVEIGRASICCGKRF